MYSLCRLCCDAFFHRPSRRIPYTNEHPDSHNSHACKRYPHDGESNGYISITGKTMGKPSKVILACGLNCKDLWDIIKRCTYNKQDRC